MIPLGRIKLKVAVVPGQTPFLISNTLVRALKATIDTDRQVLNSPFLKQSVNLHLTSKGLFLIDVNQLALQADGSYQPRLQDTFLSQDRSSEVQNEADVTERSQVIAVRCTSIKSKAITS